MSEISSDGVSGVLFRRTDGFWLLLKNVLVWKISGKGGRIDPCLKSFYIMLADEVEMVPRCLDQSH